MEYIPRHAATAREFRPFAGFRRATRKKRLRYFRRGAIMRWLWGRGSVGRAMRSQRIGQGFESPRLHHHKQTASRKRCRLFMAAKPAVGANLRATLCQKRIPLPFPFISQSVLLVRARRFGGLRSKTLLPFPPPGTCQTSLPNAPHLHLPTLMAKLPSSPPNET